MVKLQWLQAPQEELVSFFLKALLTEINKCLGRGIALQLGDAGATVYVTGRKPSDSDAAKLDYMPQLDQTAKGSIFLLFSQEIKKLTHNLCEIEC